ncbi:hypothetical protein GCM10010423_33460 [Streptomyces levis]|uniref:Uncharacterized protein n=1 Tax=Streptomyces levis TaxID=285566 RepID=A0ABN3NST0_9ACTN
MTSQHPEALDADSRPLHYRCQAAAYSSHAARSIPLGTHHTTSPRLALRWLQERTRHITDQLDPAYAQPGLHWLIDEAEHERALTYMATGTGYQLTLRDENVHYVLTAHPMGAAS